MCWLPLAALLLGLLCSPAWAALAGKLVAWGNNQYGPTNVPPGNDFAAIDAGQGYHCLALQSDGSIVGWGLNNNGQATPRAGTNFVAISAGFECSLAIQAQPPVLNISQVGNNVVISWSGNDSGFTIQAASGLSSSLNWSNVLGAPTIVGNPFVVTNSVASGNQFYRLKK